MRALLLLVAVAVVGCGSDPAPVTVEGIDPVDADADLAPESDLRPDAPLAPEADVTPEPGLAPADSLAPDA